MKLSAKFDLKPKSKGKNHQLPQILVVLAGSLAGICDGLLLGWTSPTIPELIADNSTNISLEEASYFTVISPISMILFAPLFPLLMDSIGRKKAVSLVAIPQILALILIIFANKIIWIYYIAKFISGIGDSALFGTLPIYVGEVSEPKVRGTWGNVVAVSVYLGIFLVNVIGAYNNVVNTAIICLFFPVFHILIFIFMPESPYYLLMKNKEEKAKKSLMLLRWREDVEEELLSLKNDIRRQMSESGSMKDLLTIDSNRKALLVCAGMRFVQQFCGLPAFETHTEYMFQQAGGSVSEKEASMIFTGTLFLMVVLSSSIVERAGRKLLMMISTCGCAILLTIETMYFVFAQFGHYDLSFLSWVPLTGMLLYVTVLSVGLGILPTLMIGEIFSASIKGKASSIMNIELAICTIAVPKLFQTLTYNFGVFAPFCFFTVCCYLGIIFSYYCVVETKGKTLEEIQQELKGNKPCDLKNRR